MATTIDKTKARKIFAQINSRDYTNADKNTAIREILESPEHNKITKSQMLDAMRYLVNHPHIGVSGNCSTSTTSGDYSTGATSGDCSTGKTYGDYSTGAASGNCSTGTTFGGYSTGVASGDCSTGETFGVHSVGAASGDYPTARAMGVASIACANGQHARAKAAKGSYIVLTEYNDKNELICCKMAKVDGKTIKPDVYYTLRNGKFVEA